MNEARRTGQRRRPGAGLRVRMPESRGLLPVVPAPCSPASAYSREKAGRQRGFSRGRVYFFPKPWLGDRGRRPRVPGAGGRRNGSAEYTPHGPRESYTAFSRKSQTAQTGFCHAPGRPNRRGGRPCRFLSMPVLEPLFPNSIACRSAGDFSAESALSWRSSLWRRAAACGRWTRPNWSWTTPSPSTSRPRIPSGPGRGFGGRPGSCSS